MSEAEANEKLKPLLLPMGEYGNIIEKLETDPLEATMTSVFSIWAVSKVYECPIWAFYSQSEPPQCEMRNLKKNIEERLKRENISLSKLSEIVGWDMSQLVSGKVFEFCCAVGIDFCRDFERVCGTNWLSVLLSLGSGLDACIDLNNSK